MPSKLSIQTSLPDGFLTCTATELYKIIPAPTLFHLDWECTHNNKERLFISILLHGDEVAGLHAIQSLLSQTDLRPLRPISLFVGNVDAARRQVRRLDTQIDYNRCWPGGDQTESLEGLLIQQVVEEMQRFNLFASIDIHNNTGLNPHYACINQLTSKFVNLASMFSREIVYFIRPTGVQSAAFAELCPSVTLECGTIGDADGVAHAKHYLEKLLQLEVINSLEPDHEEIEVLQTVGQMTLDSSTTFSFDGSDADVMFLNNFEQQNFKRLDVGYCIAKLRVPNKIPLLVTNENGLLETDEYFEASNNQLVLKKPLIPSMITTNQLAVRQDCLGYLMETVVL